MVSDSQQSNDLRTIWLPTDGLSVVNRTVPECAFPLAIKPTVFAPWRNVHLSVPHTAFRRPAARTRRPVEVQPTSGRHPANICSRPANVHQRPANVAQLFSQRRSDFPADVTSALINTTAGGARFAPTPVAIHWGGTAADHSSMTGALCR